MYATIIWSISAAEKSYVLVSRMESPLYNERTTASCLQGYRIHQEGYDTRSPNDAINKSNTIISIALIFFNCYLVGRAHSPPGFKWLLEPIDNFNVNAATHLEI